MFSSYVLSIFTAKSGLNLNQNFGREFVICLSQIVWQTVFLRQYINEKLWDYLGNMMTVSFIGTLFLIPALFLNLDPVSSLIYFGIVVFIMFLEHIRRCKILKLNFLPTVSWMIFRIMVLIIIILMNL